MSLLLLAGGARAADLPSVDSAAIDPLQEDSGLMAEIPVVSGASSYEQSASEAPSSVTVVTAEEIERNGFRTLAEILDQVRGFFTTYDRLYRSVAARGFLWSGDYNTRLLLLLDGHRTNNRTYDQSCFGTESLVEVDEIDRVEIIRGPASSLYGTSAFFGVINIVTKRGRSLDGAEVVLDAGSFGARRGRVAYGGKLPGGVEVLVSATHYEVDGQDLFYPEFDTAETNGGIAENLDGDRYNRAFAKVSIGDFTLRTAFSNRLKKVPTAFFETAFNDPAMAIRDRHFLGVVDYEHAFADASRFSASVGYDGYLYSGRYPYPDEVQGDMASNRWWTARTQYFYPLGSRQRLVFGASYWTDVEQAQRTFNEDPFVSILDDHHETSQWAAYVQDEIRLSHWALLNAGIRHDHYETFGGTTNPRVAAILGTARKGVVKLLYGSAFRAPNAYEIYYHDGGVTQKQATGLRPEALKTIEVVGERPFGDRVLGTLSLYRSETDHILNVAIDPADDLLVVRNVNAVLARGVEAEIRASLRGSGKAELSWAVQRCTDRATGEEQYNSPRQLAKASIEFPWLDGTLWTTIRGRFVSERPTLSGASVPAATMVDAVLFWKTQGGRVSVTTSVLNAFDRKYSDPGRDEDLQDAIPQDGRTFRASIRFAF